MDQRLPLTLALVVSLGTLGPGADARAADRGDGDGDGGGRDVDAWIAARSPARAAQGPVFIAARDPGRGAPSLVIASRAQAAPRGAPEAVARAYLERHRQLWGVGTATIAGARHLYTHDTGRGGVIVVFRQTVGGADVIHGDVKVLLDRDHRLVAISGSPHPMAHGDRARASGLPQEEAIVLALRDLYGAPIGDLALLRTRDHGGHARYELTGAGRLRFHRPARAREVYFPEGDALVPAHFVELQAQEDAGADVDVYQYVIAADDGRVLRRRDAVAQDAFTYRVWADEGGDQRPQDGPMIDYTPHPTGVPGEGPQGATAPKLVTVAGFNHGPGGGADPWLPPGATETVGNNVDAYIDHADPDGLSGDDHRAKVTAPGVFDWTYDVDAEPLAGEGQAMAAVVDLFYVNNWLHDWWYDSGFNEAAGNAQMDNFGRGGEGGDPLRAEAQDGALKGRRNNANMATPTDGESPRMQMFLWTAPSERWVDVQPLAQRYTASLAAFGPTDFDLTAPLALVDDGQGTKSDGCQAAANDLAGKIALVDRGECSYEIKAKNAQAAGAVGVLIVDNVDGKGPPALGADDETADPAIPAQGLTRAAGAALRDALQAPQSAQMFRASGVERDGTIDNMIVAHEWGHFLHHRLVECAIPQCQGQSEGWGDFLGLHTALREGDPLTGVYPLSTYATANLDASAYFGIRRAPYSVDFARNALTFRHIANGEALPKGHPIKAQGPNAEVHNVGEVWASMLWEGYIALHRAHAGALSFAEVQRRMSDYVVAGMIMAPSEPTFTEQRDAILTAIAASDMDDFRAVAAAFARRGAGTCAVSPPRGSTSLAGVVEDFEVRARGVITGVAMRDSLESCDHDGIVDVGEVGEVTVDLFNAGAAALPAGATLEIVDPPPALVLADGPLVKLGPIAAQAAAQATFEVTALDDLDAALPITLQLRLTAPGGCEETVERVLPAVVHGDLKPERAASDDVEAPTSAWTIGGGGAVWSRRAALVDGHFWHADDVGRASNTWLESPVLKVSKDEPLVIAFDHAYSFEFSDGAAWDGAVIEITRDGGQSWEDIRAHADPGYNGAIASEANPLDKRPAYVHRSPGYPERAHVVLDLGLAFAGREVKVRFRVGTDAAAGDHGWDLDNLSFSGITNTPFPAWIPDQAECQEGTSGGGEGGGGSGDPDGAGGTDGGDGSAIGSGGPGADGSAGSTDAGGDASGTDTAGGEAVDGGCRSGGRGGPWGLIVALPALAGRRRRRG